jgi:cytochrome b561
MLRRIPEGAGWVDWSHVVVGFATLPLAVAYAWWSVREGRWRLVFPWLPPQVRAVGSDLAGLLRGRIPASEGGGLFGLIEGLLLLALLAAATTGAVWYLGQGSDAALEWRAHHQFAARTLIALLLLHVAAVGTHLLEFLRD